MSILDERKYYYQTNTGNVSRSIHSLRQLVFLFCPIRDGLHPILSPNTQCLSVISSMSLQGQHNQQQQSYGDWKVASQIDVIREACCATWYWTTEGKPGKGPGSCRKLLEVILSNGSDTIEHSNILVFAKDITTKWTKVSDPELNSLKIALEALSQNQNPDTRNDHNQENAVDATATSDVLDDDAESDDATQQQKVKQELDAFLSFADDTTGRTNTTTIMKNSEDCDDHAYESDGGTCYVKDPLSGRWIHEALAPQEAISKIKQQAITTKSKNQTSGPVKSKASKKKSKKNRFTKRNAKNWVYISGLPKEGITPEDLNKYLARAGLIDLDPETLQPKLKLYKDHSTGKLKGDASVCYANKQSVDLALQVLDDSLWDKDHRIKIERAHFQAKDEENLKTNASDDLGNKEEQSTHNRYHKRHISEAQRKVKRLAILQAQDEGFGGRLTGGRKGLCIVVIKGMMEGIPDDELENYLYVTCQKFGPIEKITCISKTHVIIVKFVEPIAASAALQALNGSLNPTTNLKVEAVYWDGITDYTKSEGDNKKEQEDEERRHEEFGNWLESQEDLPSEFQLQVAKD